MKKISIVITGRDDDYGNDPHKGLYNLSFKPKSFIDRMYYTVTKNLKLFKKYFYDDFEIVIVDWSPLNEKYLYQNENLEKLLSDNSIRNVIVKPTSIQSKGLNPESFYEYFAKNVGIRNSEGEYILITNPDNYFDEDLVQEIKQELEKKNHECYYRPFSRKDVDDSGNLISEGNCFYDGNIFGLIGTPASGDFTLSHRKNIIEVATGYNELSEYSLNKDHRQTSLDGALLVNLWLNGILPVALKSSFSSFHHNKIERFNFYENLEKYKNKDTWGFFGNNFTEKNGIITYE
jgi:hypothetical protein